MNSWDKLTPSTQNDKKWVWQWWLLFGSTYVVHILLWFIITFVPIFAFAAHKVSNWPLASLLIVVAEIPMMAIGVFTYWHWDFVIDEYQLRRQCLCKYEHVDYVRQISIDALQLIPFGNPINIGVSVVLIPAIKLLAYIIRGIFYCVVAVLSAIKILPEEI